MAKLTPRVIAVLLTFLLGITATTVWYLKPSPAEEHVRLFIPNHPWEPSFFNTLEEHTKKVRLPSLRAAALPEGDVEVRLWYDGLPDWLHGVILRRSGNQWSAIYLQSKHPEYQMQQRLLNAPKSGWEAAWGRLVQAGILTLPDASEVGCRSGVLDGIGYIIETNTNKTYRTYRYGNPQFMQCAEARQMVQISDVIEEEFDFWNSPGRE